MSTSITRYCAASTTARILLTTSEEVSIEFIQIQWNLFTGELYMRQSENLYKCMLIGQFKFECLLITDFSA